MVDVCPSSFYENLKYFKKKLGLFFVKGVDSIIWEREVTFQNFYKVWTSSF